LFLITFITAIPAYFFYVPVLDDPRYIVGAGADTSVSFGAFLELLLIIANIGTAVVLYPVVKRQNEILALGYVTARIVECVFIAIGILSLLTVGLDDRTAEGGPGTFVHIPKGCVHTFRNTGEEGVGKLLITFAPAGGFEDYVGRLGEPTQEKVPPTPPSEPPDAATADAALASEHGMEVVAPPSEQQAASNS